MMNVGVVKHAAHAAFALTIVGFLASVGAAGLTTVSVQPQGDGTAGSERWSYSDPWTPVPYDANANPDVAQHWYSSPMGQSFTTYLEVAISGLPAADNINAAELYINIVELRDDWGTADYLASVNHVSNSATATGNASDRLTGDELVGTVSTSAALGWLSLDVTDFIKHDKQNGYAWSAFSFSSPGYTTVKFSSGEDAQAPHLLLDAIVPEPSAMSIALLAVVSPLVWKRERRRFHDPMVS